MVSLDKEVWFNLGIRRKVKLEWESCFTWLFFGAFRIWWLRDLEMERETLIDLSSCKSWNWMVKVESLFWMTWLGSLWRFREALVREWQVLFLSLLDSFWSLKPICLILSKVISLTLLQLTNHFVLSFLFLFVLFYPFSPQFTTHKENLLFSVIFALLLHIDHYAVEVDQLSRDLGMDPTKWVPSLWALTSLFQPQHSRLLSGLCSVSCFENLPREILLDKS